MRWLLQVFIGQEMGQDFGKKNAAVQYFCKSHMIVSVFSLLLLLLLLFLLFIFNQDCFWLVRIAANGDVPCS